MYNASRLASAKQIAANQANALASSGPRTVAGKVISAQNARTHGLLSQEVVAETERREKFEAFRLSLLASLEPVGELEVLLVDRLAACAWRLRRAGRIESETFAADVSYSWDEVQTDDSQEAAPEQSGESQVPDYLQVRYSEKTRDAETVVVEYNQQEGMICTKRTSTSPADAFDRRGKRLESLGRYERAIESSLFRALHELQRLQQPARAPPCPFLPCSMWLWPRSPAGADLRNEANSNRSRHLRGPSLGGSP